jgi:flavocytochrome c
MTVLAATSSADGSSIIDAVLIGSGFAGLTAALELLDRGGRVVIVEKEANLGGNSVKASSGINGCYVESPSGVVSQEQMDSFVQDTIRSAGDRANAQLIQTLVEHSAESLKWLKERLDVDLSSTTQLGGHAQARTHRPVKGTIGFSLISSLKKQLETYQESGMLQIMTSTRAAELVQDDNQASPVSIRGVKVIQRDESGMEKHATLYSNNVVLATGGFAAARDNDSFLVLYAPHLIDMPATFGSFSTGDGIQLASVVGARKVDMDQIQIHPTGFIDPKDPDNPSKILCAEVMRGVGGILLSQGKRFCNELGTRDYVVSQMMTEKAKIESPSFYLLLSSEAAKKAEAHVGFYSWKGLLEKFSGIDNVEDNMEIESGVLRRVLVKYRADAKYGRDEFGKTSFPDTFSNDFSTEEYYIGCVTPVLHYCMGGLTIDSFGRVLNEEHVVIPGLWAAGEVAGGVHGCNRLAGNSLLECLVYGRIIGKQVKL